jgi:hypothetical protein
LKKSWVKNPYISSLREGLRERDIIGSELPEKSE